MPNQPSLGKSSQPPSELFIRAFRDGHSGCRRECCCGREYFSDEGHPDWDEGELERLRAAAKEHPDKFIELQEWPSTLTISGHEWVIGCQCNYPRAHEEWIVFHSSAVAKYLNAQAKEMRERATAMAVAKILEGDPPLPQNYYPILH